MVEEVEVFEAVVWVEVFEAADFEEALVALERVDDPAEFHLGGLDLQE